MISGNFTFTCMFGLPRQLMGSYFSGLSLRNASKPLDCSKIRGLFSNLENPTTPVLYPRCGGRWPSQSKRPPLTRVSAHLGAAHIDGQRDANHRRVLAFVQAGLDAHAVAGLAHQHPPHAGILRVHGRERAVLAGQRVIQLERLALDLHVRETRDLHVELRADPGEALRQPRELQRRVDLVHDVLVADEVHRVLDAQHVRASRVEDLHPARRLDQVAHLQRLPGRAQQLPVRALDRERIAAQGLRLPYDDLTFRKHTPTLAPRAVFGWEKVLPGPYADENSTQHEETPVVRD